MMTPFDKRNLREINDFFSYLPLYFEFTIGRNGACHFIRNFPPRLIRSMPRSQAWFLTPPSRIQVSPPPSSTRYYPFRSVRETELFRIPLSHIQQPPDMPLSHTPVSDIPERYGIRVPACHPGYFHRQKTKASLPHPRPHPESHNTGEVSALFFLDRPESKLKHFVVVLRVSGDLLRRIQTVIDMIFHDLLIVALRDLTENEPLRLTNRPGQSQMAPCDPLQKLFICILDICDQCVRTPFIFLPVFSP